MLDLTLFFIKSVIYPTPPPFTVPRSKPDPRFKRYSGSELIWRSRTPSVGENQGARRHTIAVIPTCEDEEYIAKNTEVSPCMSNDIQSKRVQPLRRESWSSDVCDFSSPRLGSLSPIEIPQHTLPESDSTCEQNLTPLRRSKGRIVSHPLQGLSVVRVTESTTIDSIALGQELSYMQEYYARVEREDFSPTKEDLSPIKEDTSQPMDSPSAYTDECSSRHSPESAGTSHILTGSRYAEGEHEERLNGRGIDIIIRDFEDEDDALQGEHCVPALTLTFPTPEVPHSPVFAPQLPLFVGQQHITVAPLSSPTSVVVPDFVPAPPTLPRCTHCGFGFGMDMLVSSTSVATTPYAEPCAVCAPDWYACRNWYEEKGSPLRSPRLRSGKRTSFLGLLDSSGTGKLASVLGKKIHHVLRRITGPQRTRNRLKKRRTVAPPSLVMSDRTGHPASVFVDTPAPAGRRLSVLSFSRMMRLFPVSLDS
ncbi:hypothetical protein FISHEDRAFT_78283 [Fistulina hepatica ATCC 64428]|nr:hypothetical protein FISHEDRAFT_78283 [Fistulina hepatica ATCC 64428]